MDFVKDVLICLIHNGNTADVYVNLDIHSKTDNAKRIHLEMTIHHPVMLGHTSILSKEDAYHVLMGV